ncbi:MFS transporter [Thioalkalivibrio sp. ALJ9]|uniref:MFS transporter n=1 Tax=Thioalkalivibrio sp. ALJ9 TaxID=1158758 RepID=UPI00035C1C65|nr:MFS transporter [Thioalkalivibrio sp. ALJ9]
MARLLIPIVALLASVTILVMGSGLMGTLVSTRLSLEAIDPQLKGLIMSAYYIGLVIGAQQGDWVIRRTGHIRAFAIFAAIATVAILLLGLHVDVWAWFALRVVIGFCLAGAYLVVESWLHARTENRTRGRVFSVYQFLAYLGLAAGQPLLNLYEPVTTELFMVVAALFALCLVPVALTRTGMPQDTPGHKRMKLRQVVTASPLAATVCVAAGLVSGAAFTLTPVFALRMGLDIAGVSLVMTSLILGGVVLQWPIGYFSDRFGRRTLMIVVGGGVALISLALVATIGAVPLWAILTLAGVFGGLAFTLYPLAVSHANDVLQPNDFVAVTAALLFLWGLGAVAGPILGGWAIALLGGPGLLAYMATIGALVALIALLLRRDTAEAREPFRTLTRTTPVIHHLDPRALPQTEGEAEEEARTQASDNPPSKGPHGHSPSSTEQRGQGGFGGTGPP